MSNVVNLPLREPEQVVWRCDCGCITFFVREDAELECAQCGEPANVAVGEWRQNLPPAPAEVLETEAGDTTITDLNDSAAAMRRVCAKADADNSAAVIVIQQSGAVSAWGSKIETDDQLEWLKRRFETAKDMLVERRRG